MTHYHCLDGCEKAQGELVEGELVCADPRCRAPYLPCNPEICPENPE